jgi:hypothetical protein
VLLGQLETVAGSRLGLDLEKAARMLCELCPDPFHIDVDASIASSHRVAPDPLVENLPAHGAAGRFRKRMEHLSLPAGQSEILTIPVGFTVDVIDPQGPELKWSARPNPGTADDCRDPRRKLALAHAFMDDIVGAELEQIGRGRRRSAGQPRDQGAARILATSPEKQAVSGHARLEDESIGAIRPKRMRYLMFVADHSYEGAAKTNETGLDPLGSITG